MNYLWVKVWGKIFLTMLVSLSLVFFLVIPFSIWFLDVLIPNPPPSIYVGKIIFLGSLIGSVVLTGYLYLLEKTFGPLE